MFSTVLQGFKELIFPDNCILCRTYLNSRHQRQLCTSCISQIKMNTPPWCMTCGRHMEAYAPEGICAPCRSKPSAFDRAWSVCFYQKPMDHLIHSFKYSGKTALAKTFDMLFKEYAQTYHLNFEEFDFMMPMPLHAARLRERGFNQSQILCERLSAWNGLPVKEGILVRRRATPTQTALDSKQRWTNLEGAFTINQPLEIADKSILLVDDLLTTGATAHSAALCLKNAGAAYVGVLTIAVTQ